MNNLPAIQEMQVPSVGWEDPLEKKMAIHSSILAWKIPWTEEPGGLQSLGSQESDATERQNRHHHVCIYLQHNEHLLEFKLQEIVKNREAWHVAGLEVTKSWTHIKSIV